MSAPTLSGRELRRHRLAMGVPLHRLLLHLVEAAVAERRRAVPLPRSAVHRAAVAAALDADVGAWLAKDDDLVVDGLADQLSG